MKQITPSLISIAFLSALFLSSMPVAAGSFAGGATEPNEVVAPLDVEKDLPDTLETIRDTVRSEKTGSDFQNALSAVGHVVTSPLRWDSEDLSIAGGVLAATAVSVALDNEARSLMLRNRSRFNEKVVPIGYDYGAPEYAGPGAIGVTLIGVIIDNDWMRQTGWMLTESIATIGLVQIPARLIAGRARPLAHEGHASFKPLQGADQNHASFISGHSAIAFASSTVLAHQIDNIWATIGLYSLAVLTPYVRLYEDAHWLSDAFFGSVLGMAIGSAVVHFHKENGLLSTNMMLLPTSNGVMLAMAF